MKWYGPAIIVLSVAVFVLFMWYMLSTSFCCVSAEDQAPILPAAVTQKEPITMSQTRYNERSGIAFKTYVRVLALNQTKPDLVLSCSSNGVSVDYDFSLVENSTNDYLFLLESNYTSEIFGQFICDIDAIGTGFAIKEYSVSVR